MINNAKIVQIEISRQSYRTLLNALNIMNMNNNTVVITARERTISRLSR